MASRTRKLVLSKPQQSRLDSTAIFESLERRQLFAAVPVLPKFTETDLVSDGAVAAAHTDANLVNAWGLAFTKAGVAWVGNNGTGTSTVYDTTGNNVGPVVTIPPATGSATNALVTGVAYAAIKNTFNITGNGQTVPAEYVFVSESGTISGWDPAIGDAAVNVVDHSASGAVYKGVAISGKGKKAQILAANFHAGTIEVYDSTFQPVTPAAGAFTDPSLPAGFAPFNVQVIGSKVYVMYAKQDADATGDVRGAGNGVVDVYNAKGKLTQHLIASGGALNSPWGMVQGAGRFKSDILVGNFGDGTINVFNKKGIALGPVQDASGATVTIHGLWGLAYGTTKSTKSTLFFAAGPNFEANGLFGSLTLLNGKVAHSSGGGGFGY